MLYSVHILTYFKNTISNSLLKVNNFFYSKIFVYFFAKDVILDKNYTFFYKGKLNLKLFVLPIFFVNYFSTYKNHLPVKVTSNIKSKYI